ncbi:MAG: GNAT family N-acetyltransferase [Arenimonas sp.]
MNGRVELVPLIDRERWLAQDARDGRPSQSWHYAHAIAQGGFDPQLAVVEADGGRLCLPLHVRSWREDCDIATWIGLSGVSTQGDVARAWSVWREFAVAQGWVAGYLQLADDADLGELHPDDALVAGNAVFLLDLQDDPIGGAAEIVRRKIRRAQREGVGEARNPESIANAFASLYPLAMGRLGATDAYRHSPQALRELVALPGAVVVGAELDEQIEAVAVFLRAGTRAEYLCNGCTERGRELAAWQIARAISHLRELGVRELNLGGGLAPGDGLYDFKARFNGQVRPLRALRQVYAPNRYAELCAAAGRDPSAHWFPAYRAPP